jgi:hypothetical protein
VITERLRGLATGNKKALLNEQGFLLISDLEAAFAATTTATTAIAVTTTTATTPAVTVETTTTTAAPTTTAFTAPTPTTAATTARSFFARSGFVHGQRAPTKVFAIHGGNGSLGFVLFSHFNETEAARFTSELVFDDSGGSDATIRLKGCAKLNLCSRAWQIANIDIHCITVSCERGSNQSPAKVTNHEWEPATHAIPHADTNGCSITG